MNRDPILSLAGLAMKAGKAVSGEFAVEKEGKKGTACLILIAEDASGGTKKSLKDMCTFYQIPCIEYGRKEELGKSVGKDYRAAIAILDPGFSRSIMKKYQSEKEE